LDAAVVTDREKFRPKCIQLWSVLLFLDQPLGECELGLKWVRASIGSNLVHVRARLTPVKFDQDAHSSH
jgi:hypothetical protein